MNSFIDRRYIAEFFYTNGQDLLRCGGCRLAQRNWHTSTVQEKVEKWNHYLKTRDYVYKNHRPYFRL